MHIASYNLIWKIVECSLCPYVRLGTLALSSDRMTDDGSALFYRQAFFTRAERTATGPRGSGQQMA
jgi:hypothetical protein